MTKIICVYQIVNVVNNKIYVGSAIDFNRRKNTHLRLLNLGEHHSIKLQNSFNKYGKDKFKFEILERLTTSENLISVEQKYLDSLKPHLNMVLIAGLNSHIGMKRSQETKNKMRNSQLGKTHTQETKEKLRQINLGKRQSENTINKKRRAQFKTIQQIKLNGEIIEWDSPTIAAQVLKISRSVIYDCIAGRKKSYKQSKWCYKFKIK